MNKETKECIGCKEQRNIYTAFKTKGSRKCRRCYSQNSRNKKKQNGKCVDCPLHNLQNALPNKTRCELHQNKMKEFDKKRKTKKTKMKNNIDDPTKTKKGKLTKEEQGRLRQEKNLNNMREYYIRNEESEKERHRQYGANKRAHDKLIRKKAILLSQDPINDPLPHTKPGPALYTTIGGFISGDGCLTDGSLKITSQTRDVLQICQELLGGKINKRGNYYFWKLNRLQTREIIPKIINYTWSKASQMKLYLDSFEKGISWEKIKDQVTILKNTPYTIDINDLKEDELDQIIAGFFTADGHITIRGNQPYIVFGQKFDPILHVIASNYQGCSSIQEYNPTANGSKTDSNGDLYKASQLSLSGEYASDFIKRIEPWVLNAHKRETCQLLLTMTKENRDNVYLRMSILRRYIENSEKFD